MRSIGIFNSTSDIHDHDRVFQACWILDIADRRPRSHRWISRPRSTITTARSTIHDHDPRSTARSPTMTARSTIHDPAIHDHDPRPRSTTCAVTIHDPRPRSGNLPIHDHDRTIAEGDCPIHDHDRSRAQSNIPTFYKTRVVSRL